MSIRGKRGFIINGKFISVGARGHESGAIDIVNDYGWYDEWHGKGYAQDFLVINKGAIQIGSGRDFNKIVVYEKHHNISKVDRIKKKYRLEDYDVIIIQK